MIWQIARHNGVPEKVFNIIRSGSNVKQSGKVKYSRGFYIRP